MRNLEKIIQLGTADKGDVTSSLMTGPSSTEVLCGLTEGPRKAWGDWLLQLTNTCLGIENRLVDAVGEGEGGMS